MTTCKKPLKGEIYFGSRFVGLWSIMEGKVGISVTCWWAAAGTGASGSSSLTSLQIRKTRQEVYKSQGLLVAAYIVHPLKALNLPQTGLLVGKKVFKLVSLCGTFHIQTTVQGDPLEACVHWVMAKPEANLSLWYLQGWVEVCEAREGPLRTISSCSATNVRREAHKKCKLSFLKRNINYF